MKRRDFIKLSLGAIGFALAGVSTSTDQEGLTQIHQGIYGYSSKIDRTENATLIVHPFYINQKDNPNYFKNLEAFLSRSNGPIITLEEWKKLRQTASHYQRLGCFNNCFFIPTEISNPRPKEMAWEDLSDFLKKFNVNPLFLAGGFYEGLGYGCLGSTELVLGSLGLSTKVKDDLTFHKGMEVFY